MKKVQKNGQELPFKPGKKHDQKHKSIFII